MRISKALALVLLPFALMGCVDSEYEPGVPKVSSNGSDSGSANPIYEAVNVAGAWTCNISLVDDLEPVSCTMVLTQTPNGGLGGSYAMPKLGFAGSVSGFVFQAKVDLIWIDHGTGEDMKGWEIKATATPSMMVGVWGGDKGVPFTAWR